MPRRFFQSAARAKVVSIAPAPEALVVPTDTPLLTVEQVAAKLRIPVKQVYRRVAEDFLPTRRVGRSLRFDARELEAWTLRHREGRR